MINNINEKLKEEIKKIIRKEDVKYVIGYKKGTYGIRTTPAFAVNENEVDKFIFSPVCVNNLATYLSRDEQVMIFGDENNVKVGIVAKGCDARTIIQLINEKRINRDNLIIIGVACYGVIDKIKLENFVTKKNIGIDKITDIYWENENYIIRTDDKKYVVKKDDMIMSKCKSCRFSIPQIYDILIGEKKEILQDDEYDDVNQIEKMSINDRWDYWITQFDKCIRCYACREICPMCYCKECITTKTMPTWISKSITGSENMVYHIIRTMHLAGRCTECGECERVCPVSIPIMKIMKKMTKDVKELFGYEAGIDIGEKPFPSSFDPSDPEEFIL